MIGQKKCGSKQQPGQVVGLGVPEFVPALALQARAACFKKSQRCGWSRPRCSRFLRFCWCFFLVRTERNFQTRLLMSMQMMSHIFNAGNWKIFLITSVCESKMIRAWWHLEKNRRFNCSGKLHTRVSGKEAQPRIHFFVGMLMELFRLVPKMGSILKPHGSR